jgi:N-acetylneuraminic acid mutarotase
MKKAPQAVSRHQRMLLAFVATGALVTGLLVYLFDRDPASIYLLPAAWSLADDPSSLGWFGGALPAFAHAFAFTLLTAIVLGATRRAALCASALWWTAGSAIEIAQHPVLARHVADALPRWLDSLPLLENTAPFFIRGTFDPWDLVALTAGVFAAFGLVTLTLRWKPSAGARRRSGIRALSVSLVAVLGLASILGSGGGGGGGGNGVEPGCQWGDIYVDTPTHEPLWGTDSPTIDLAGWARSPDGLYDFSNCPGDPGYTITWRNETTGATGTGGAWSTVLYSPLGPYCHTGWWADGIPLAPDHNAILIRAEREGVLVGEDCIDVRRMPEAAGSWQPTSTAEAPAPRGEHTAAWTGTEMIVWGGYDGDYVTTGGRYDPAADSWAGVSTIGAPAARSGHTAVWTGTEMIVWGGHDGGYLASGGRYEPFTDTWTAMSTTGVPAARSGHTAVWTGTEMIVWGGHDGGFLASGGRYNPATDSWTAVSATGAPSPRAWHTAVWTGTEMIVWGGLAADGVRLNSGARYNPSTNTWSAISATDAPEARYQHTAVWNGSGLIVWGGVGGTLSLPAVLATGGIYDPLTNRWHATWSAGLPGARQSHTAVWTGAGMIIWGGYDGVSSGSRYDPVTDGWTATTLTEAPAGRHDHTAVWTGNEMVIWGGRFGGIYPGVFPEAGGRYTP